MGSTEAFDFSELEAEAKAESENPVEKPDLNAVHAMGLKAAELESRIIKGETLLKRLKSERYELLTNELPAAMTEVKVPELTVDGFLIKCRNYYKAAIKADDPPEQRERAFDWLEKNEGGDIIKYSVEVTFPTESYEDAKSLAVDLERRFHNQPAVTVLTQRTVPWATLTSWLRGLVEAPMNPKKPKPEIPMLDLNATIGRVAEIKPVRE